MEYIFLPVDNVSDFACYSVLDKDTIRAYYTMPRVNSSSEYIDFYINSHYLEKSGTQTWSQYNTILPVCLSSSSITNDKFYRNDLPDIMIIFSCMFLFIFVLSYKLMRLPFGRWLKL